ncbi:MAG: carbohydrate binding family 9 domain-containing protein [Gemmatimonadetes bacterium]|nr:carbohydrate binding family 9 domain-containing protein [Gemmatimonadota bacterium]
MTKSVPARLLALALALWPTTVLAQEAGGGGAGGGSLARPVLTAGVLTDGIRIDGRLDDEAWGAVRPAMGFIQGEPVEGIPAEHDTEIRIAFFGEALYVAARMFDDDPESIADQLVRRDQQGQYDFVRVQLDPNLDRRTGYAFQVSAANVQRDEYLYDDERMDDAWDAVWESAVARDDQGWTVEMRIPLSQIRYESDQDAQTWGINVSRRRLASNELSYFSLKSRVVEGLVSQFGTLEGVQVPSSVRRIEARPYMLSSLHRGPTEAGNPFFDGSDAAGRMGLDLRFGLGSAFTLDATLNPDFGQVESDPAVINLSAFEVFQEERRPFFVEDAQVLNFTLSGRRNSLFYSRRIGRAPQGGSPSGASFVDRPDNATILGAAKMTGRTASGLSVGALAAMTDRESGRALLSDGEQGGIEPYVVEPRTEYGVVRAVQDLRDGMTQLGAIVTLANRNLPNDGGFDFLPSSSLSTGIDFEHQWSNRTWKLGGFLAGSHIRGDSTAMIRVQRASNHLYHRPDATRLSVDSAATSLSGLEWRLQLDKQNGRHWTGGIWLGQVTSGFEVNDMGFSQNSEKLDAGMRVSYREIEPGSIFRNYNISFFTFHNWSHEALDEAGSWDSWRRAQTAGSFNIHSRGELLNWWGVNADLSVNPNNYSRNATRGGPVMQDPGSARASLRFNSDRRKALSFGFGGDYRTGFRDSGGNWGVGAEVQYRPSPRVELSMQPRWSKATDAAQYVTSTGTLTYDPTYGRRYLFAELERTTFSMETRMNVSVSPTLTFQLFAQPLLSSGDYVRYRQLATPFSFDFVEFGSGTASEQDGAVLCSGGTACSTTDTDGDVTQHLDFDADGRADYAFGDRDFNQRSLIGNAVLRWEYRPGSTLFLVWQRQQRGRIGDGSFDFGRDLGALFDAPADNVFMIKINYWLGL